MSVETPRCNASFARGSVPVRQADSKVSCKLDAAIQLRLSKLLRLPPMYGATESASFQRVKRLQFGVLSPDEIVCNLCVLLRSLHYPRCSQFCDALWRLKRRQSVVTITEPAGHRDGIAVAKGLYDPAMGAMDASTVCETCKSTYKGVDKDDDCPGHFGSIEVGSSRLFSHALSCFPQAHRVRIAKILLLCDESSRFTSHSTWWHLLTCVAALPSQLASPVYHPGYFEEVYKILQCICYNCCRIRTSKPSRLREILAVKPGKARLNALYTLCAAMVACGHSEDANETKRSVTNLTFDEPQSEEDGGCYFVQPKFHRIGLTIYTCDRKRAKGDPGDRDVLRMEKAYAMLQRIPDSDLKYLGLNSRFIRPEHLMITVTLSPSCGICTENDACCVVRCLRCFRYRRLT